MSDGSYLSNNAHTHIYTHTRTHARTHTHRRRRNQQWRAWCEESRGWECQKQSESTRGCVKSKIVTEIIRSSARDTFIGESVYLVLNSLLDWIFTCWCTSHGLLYVYIIIYSTLHLLRVPCVDAWRWHVWPWLSEFSGVAVSCFTLSRSTIFAYISLIKLVGSFKPLFKAILCSVSGVRKLVNRHTVVSHSILGPVC